MSQISYYNGWQDSVISKKESNAPNFFEYFSRFTRALSGSISLLV
jgi:hypothetical protein